MPSVQPPTQRADSPDAVPALRITVEPEANLIGLHGRLCALTVGDVRATIIDVLDSGEGDLALDLTDVELVDASGLGVLVGAHRLATRAERRLVLRGVPPRVDRLLSVTRLNRVLVIEEPVAV